MKDPLKTAVERKQITLVNLGAKPVRLKRGQPSSQFDICTVTLVATNMITTLFRKTLSHMNVKECLATAVNISLHTVNIHAACMINGNIMRMKKLLTT
eukprot:6504191-Karenia_brevis.AAC.1